MQGLAKGRNVKEYLPKNGQGDYDRRIRNAYAMAGYAEAKAELGKIVSAGAICAAAHTCSRFGRQYGEDVGELAERLEVTRRCLDNWRAERETVEPGEYPPRPVT